MSDSLLNTNYGRLGLGIYDRRDYLKYEPYEPYMDSYTTINDDYGMNPIESVLRYQDFDDSFCKCGLSPLVRNVRREPVMNIDGPWFNYYYYVDMSFSFDTNLNNKMRSLQPLYFNEIGITPENYFQYVLASDDITALIIQRINMDIVEATNRRFPNKDELFQWITRVELEEDIRLNKHVVENMFDKCSSDESNISDSFLEIISGTKDE